MTIAAVAEISGLPVLISDTLESRIGKNGSHTDTPLLSSNFLSDKYPEEHLRIVIGMRRKLSLVAPNLALVWAGSSIAASSVIGDIRNEATDQEEFSFDYLNGIFRKVELGKLELQLAGCYLTKMGFEYFLWNSNSLLEQVTPPVTIGSGRLVFDHFHEVGSFAPPDGFLPQYSSAVMYAQNFVTRQLGDELHFADSPSFLFGGAYEAAIHNSNGFELLENTTFLFWQVNIGEERIAVLNFTLINQYYRAKKLVVEVCKLSTQSPYEHTIAPISIYEIGTKKSQKVTPTPRHYVPQNICNYVFLSDNRYDHTVSCQVPVNPTGDFIEYRSLDSGEEYILIHDNWYKQLEKLNLPVPEGKIPDFPYE